MITFIPYLASRKVRQTCTFNVTCTADGDPNVDVIWTSSNGRNISLLGFHVNGNTLFADYNNNIPLGV